MIGWGNDSGSSDPYMTGWEMRSHSKWWVEGAQDYKVV